MKNLLNKMKKCNKGFTMVELIVVVAIIAVLAVVLAPQYIKYVEKSKVAADQSIAANIEKTINIVAAEGALTPAGAATTVDITWNTVSGVVDNTDVADMLSGSSKAQSKTATDIGSIKFTVTWTDDDIKVTKDQDYTAW